MSDELIEAMARAIAPDIWATHDQIQERDPAWCEIWKSSSIEQEGSWGNSLSRARALLPVIRAHLEPTSEMVEVGIDAIAVPYTTIEKRTGEIWRAMLAASPIGDVG